MPGNFTQTDRTTIGRLPARGSYDRVVAHAVLDEALICHVGLVAEHGPVVIPTTFARDGESLLIHGAPAATWLRRASSGTPVCVTVTLLDALVLARSAFHHSMNYRSVVVFGTAVPVTDLEEKQAALDAIVEHVVPGRLAEVRPHHDAELRTTLVLRVPLEEASVKVRTGGPVDDEDDRRLPHWAGIIPVWTAFGSPETDETVPSTSAPPPSATGYRRPG